MSEQGFCDHCYSWGKIVDHDRNMCDTCKEIENGRNRNLHPVRTTQESVRSLPPSNPRG